MNDGIIKGNAVKLNRRKTSSTWSTNTARSCATRLPPPNGMGLEASELAALEHLQAAGAINHKRLGERPSMSPGAITAMIDRLERRGYVERITQPRRPQERVVKITKVGSSESLT